MSNSSIAGATYINKTTFSGTLDANIPSPSGGYSTHFYGSNIQGNVSGYVLISSSILTGSNVSSTVLGNPSVYGSMLTRPTITCNAYVNNETTSDKTYGCNYVSENPLQRDIIGIMDESRQSMEESRYQSTAEWQNWLLSKEQEIRNKF